MLLLFTLNTSLETDPEVLKRGKEGGGANLAKCGILYTLILCIHEHTSKKGKVESTPL